MITSIHVTNFRGLREARLDNLPPSVLALGLNGQGKTSLLDAVRFVLTGVVYGQDEKRLRVPDLIGPHAREAYVALGLGGLDSLTLECRINSKGSTLRAVNADGAEVFAGSPDEVRRALCRRLGIDPKHLHACCHPRSTLVSGDLSALLAEMAGGIELDALAATCGEHWEAVAAFIEERHLPAKTPRDLAAIGKAAYDERTAVQREAKQLAAAAAVEQGPVPTAAGGRVLTVADLPAVEKALREMSGERDTLHREIGAASSRRAADAIAADLSAAEAAFAAITLPDLAHAEGVAREAKAAADLAMEQFRAASAAVNRAEEAVEAMNAEPGPCPTCGQKRGKAKVTAEQARERRREAELARDRAKSAHDALAARNAEAEGAEATLRDVRQRHAAAQAERARLSARVEALRAEQPAAGSVAELQAKLDALDGRIASATTAREALGRMREHAERRARVEALKAQVETLDWMVAAFRDGDVTQALGAGARDQFVARVNERLAEHGYALSMVADGANVTACLGRTGETPKPVAWCSDGEIMLAQLAIVEAFACGVAVLDRLDCLDGARRVAVVQSLGNVLAAAAYGIAGEPPLDAMAAAMAPVALVWVEGGAARVVEAGSARAAA